MRLSCTCLANYLFSLTIIKNLKITINDQQEIIIEQALMEECYENSRRVSRKLC